MLLELAAMQQRLVAKANPSELDSKVSSSQTLLATAVMSQGF